MSLPVSRFPSNCMLATFFLLFSSNSCETTQKWNFDSVSYHHTSVPCKGLNVIFPCGKFKTSPLGQKSKTSITLNGTSYENPLKTGSTSPGMKTNIRNPFPLTFPFPSWVFETNGAIFPWKIMYPPQGWGKSKTPLNNNKIRTTITTEKLLSDFPFGKMFPAGAKSLGSWSWEKTRDSYPRKITKAPYPWEPTSSPNPWGRETTPNSDHNDNNDSSDTAIAVILPVIGLLLYIFCLTCNAFLPLCKNTDDVGGSNSSMSRPIWRSSPRSSIRTDQNQMASVAINSNLTQFTSMDFSPLRSEIQIDGSMNSAPQNPTASSSNRTKFTSTNISRFTTPSLSGTRLDIFSDSLDRSQTQIDGSMNSAPRNPTSGIIINFPTSKGDSGTPSDKPPGYSTVVLDSFAESNKFPEVKPKNELDASPPSYNEKF